MSEVNWFELGLILFFQTASRGLKKKEVNPKLLFPFKEWIKSYHPNHWKHWNKETGLPRKSDEEDWVQLEKQVGYF